MRHHEWTTSRSSKEDGTKKRKRGEEPPKTRTRLLWGWQLYSRFNARHCITTGYIQGSSCNNRDQNAKIVDYSARICWITVVYGARFIVDSDVKEEMPTIAWSFCWVVLFEDSSQLKICLHIVFWKHDFSLHNTLFLQLVSFCVFMKAMYETGENYFCSIFLQFRVQRMHFCEVSVKFS